MLKFMAADWFLEKGFAPALIEVTKSAVSVISIIDDFDGEIVISDSIYRIGHSLTTSGSC
jgi:hypothetical protein